MKLPFSIWPYSWGLKGLARELAKIDYYLVAGYEWSVARANLLCEGKELKKELLEIQYRHDVITEYEYSIKVANFIDDEIERDKHILKTEYKEGNINKNELTKQLADLNNEPWVTVIRINVDKQTPERGEFELDWNNTFIKMLEEAGYVSPSQEQTVDGWFNDLCRNIALEEFGGIGDFEERVTSVDKIQIDNDRWAKE